MIVCVPVTLLLLCFSKSWKGRLVKEGSLAPHTCEKFGVIFRGVTISIGKLKGLVF